MSTTYGFSFDLYTKSGKLLRAGNVYANTFAQLKINSASVFWVIVGNSAEMVRAGDVIWHKQEFDSTQNKKYSDKFVVQFDEYMLKYQYTKVRDLK